MNPKEKSTIGRREMIDLPDFGLFRFEAKVDTGAYTSAIHCSHVRVFEEDGVAKISFHIPGPNNQGVTAQTFVSDNFKLKNIRSSFGHTEKRYVIKTRVRLAGRTFFTEFSLSDRTRMRYPVLLGRKMLRHRFVVDVAELHLAPYKPKTHM